MLGNCQQREFWKYRDSQEQTFKVTIGLQKVGTDIKICLLVIRDCGLSTEIHSGFEKLNFFPVETCIIVWH